MVRERRVIMVIEDDAAVRELMAEVLRDEGYEVVECEGAEQALTLMKSLHPDLITLDLAMPSMDGIQFLQLLRERSDTAGVPVVVVTAAPEDFRYRLAREVQTLGKPFHLDQLLEAVERGLKSRAIR